MADAPGSKTFSPEWMRQGPKESNGQVLPKPDNGIKGNLTSDSDFNRGARRDRGPPVSNPGRGRGGGGGPPPGEKWGGPQELGRQQQQGNSRRQSRDYSRELQEDDGRGRRGAGLVQYNVAPHNGIGIAPSVPFGGFPQGNGFGPFGPIRNDPNRGGMVHRGQRGPDLLPPKQEEFPSLGLQRNMQHPHAYSHAGMMMQGKFAMAPQPKVPQRQQLTSRLADLKGGETQQVNPLLPNGSSGAAVLAAVAKEAPQRRMAEALKQAPVNQNKGTADKPRLVDAKQAKLVPIVNQKPRAGPNQATNQPFYPGLLAPRPPAPDAPKHVAPTGTGTPAMLKLPGNPRARNSGFGPPPQSDKVESHFQIPSGAGKGPPAVLGVAAGSVAVTPAPGPAGQIGDAKVACPKAPDTPGSGKRGNDRTTFFKSLKKDKVAATGTGESIVSQSSTDSVSLPTSPMAGGDGQPTRAELLLMDPPSPVTSNVQYEMAPASSPPKSRLTTWAGVQLPNTPSSAPPMLALPSFIGLGAAPDSIFAGLAGSPQSYSPAQDAAGRAGKDTAKAEVAPTSQQKGRGPFIFPRDEDLEDLGFFSESPSTTKQSRGPATDMSIHAQEFVPRWQQISSTTSQQVSSTTSQQVSSITSQQVSSTTISSASISSTSMSVGISTHIAQPPQQYHTNANANQYPGYAAPHQSWSPGTIPNGMQNSLRPMPYPHAGSPLPTYPSPQTHVYHTYPNGMRYS